MRRMLIPLLLALPAAAEERPLTVLELAECHAYTEARLAATAERLGRMQVWTSAHQHLAIETRRHEQVERTLDQAMDRRARRAWIAAHHPEGLESDDPNERVDRWTRCRRLYNLIGEAEDGGNAAQGRL